MHRISAYELGICRSANRICSRPTAECFFRVVSRLGNGVAWYALILILPIVYGASAIDTSLLMSAVGLAGLLFYKLIKSYTERPRPYAVNGDIRLGTAPLDQYSFPSGHTLHAVSFSLVATAAHPELGVLLWPFTLCVAMSRVVLGLHYPTDVAAGALIGATLASVALLV